MMCLERETLHYITKLIHFLCNSYAIAFPRLSGFEHNNLIDNLFMKRRGRCKDSKIAGNRKRRRMQYNLCILLRSPMLFQYGL